MNIASYRTSEALAFCLRDEAMEGATTTKNPSGHRGSVCLWLCLCPRVTRTHSSLRPRINYVRAAEGASVERHNVSPWRARAVDQHTTTGARRRDREARASAQAGRSSVGCGLQVVVARPSPIPPRTNTRRYMYLIAPRCRSLCGGGAAPERRGREATLWRVMAWDLYTLVGNVFLCLVGLGALSACRP